MVSGPRWPSWPSPSGRARKARRPCRTRRIPFGRSASADWPQSCGHRALRAWRASRYGTTGLRAGLTVDAARMLANLESSHGLIYSSAVLLELVAAGLSREDAYSLVQAAAMDTWQSGLPFRETLRKHAAGRDQELHAARPE